MALKKSMRMAFPVITAGQTSATYEYQSKRGQMKGRGRPKGSLDPRYAQYGGVMGFRKYMSSQRRAFRQQLQQQKEMMKVQRQIANMPQYEQAQQYQQQQQLPPEMQGQGVTPDYTQFDQADETGQMQPQVEQHPFEYLQEPQKPPVARVFKSYGGSPYQPVDRRSLTPSNQTIQQGYVETTDAFTGRRYMKQLPKPERWSAGG
jgi:hypothetical protein